MFDWDAANIAHIARHNITPDEAEQVLLNRPLGLERQLRKGEERFPHLGETDAGRILFVVITLRNDARRVVTAFPADRASRSFYLIEKGNTDAPDSTDP